MSKKSPRKPSPRRRPREPLNVEMARWWERRVFRNSYTHRGRLVRVRKWSVKIQFQGVRRTLSLTSLRRIDAAREAAELYQQILKEGWSAIEHRRRAAAEPSATPVANGLAEARLDPAYWEERLIRRPYPHPDDAQSQWSVRIDHHGSGGYFPLGSLDRKAAAQKALRIYQTILDDGWDAAHDLHAREVTIGFHWVLNPVAWTYTTLHTQPNGAAASAADEKKSATLPVTIVEPEAAIRAALARWVEMQPGVACVARIGDVESALQRAASNPKEFWLINRSLPEGQGSEVLERLQQLATNLTGVMYCVYEDSNQLFLGTPGGASVYLLKRTSADQLLAPILTAPLSVPHSPTEVLLRVRNYFQPCLAFGTPGEATRALTSLTAREHDILECLSKGYVDKEIATRLNISAWTVHGHLKKIFEKLDVHTRTEAVVRFLQK
jgi:DNA-binding NarL/FixJ family response regulator